MLVQEQRFAASAIEDERVAPLEARDQFSLARFFDEEIADCVLRRRLRRRRSDIDELGSLPRVFQKSPRNEMVIDDDVGRAEMIESVNGDEAGIAGTGPNQIDGGLLHGCSPWTVARIRSTSARISAAPWERRSLAAASPTAPG